MTLLWAVPVAAAALATLVVVAWARLIEDATVEVAHAVRRLHAIRAPLGAVRTTMAETDDVVASFRHHHPFDADRAAGSGPDGDTAI